MYSSTYIVVVVLVGQPPEPVVLVDEKWAWGGWWWWWFEVVVPYRCIIDVAHCVTHCEELPTRGGQGTRSASHRRHQTANGGLPLLIVTAGQ